MKNYPYIHLRTQSSYSLSEGALKIKKLINLTKENDMPSIALTDNNNLFGALEFSIECIENGIHPIIGTSINIIEIKLNNICAQINFLVKNKIGYKNLLYLSSLSHTNNGQNLGIHLNDIKNYSQGLICYIGGEFNPTLFYKHLNKSEKIDNFLSFLLKNFNDNFYFELQRINNNILDEYENEFIE